MQNALAVNEANLKSVATGFEALDHELEWVRNVLAHANDYFNLSNKRLRLDRMNDRPQSGRSANRPSGSPIGQLSTIIAQSRCPLL